MHVAGIFREWILDIKFMECLMFWQRNSIWATALLNGMQGLLCYGKYVNVQVCNPLPYVLMLRTWVYINARKNVSSRFSTDDDKQTSRLAS